VITTGNLPVLVEVLHAFTIHPVERMFLKFPLNSVIDSTQPHDDVSIAIRLPGTTECIIVLVEDSEVLYDECAGTVFPPKDCVYSRRARGTPPYDDGAIVVHATGLTATRAGEGLKSPVAGPYRVRYVGRLCYRGHPFLSTNHSREEK